MSDIETIRSQIANSVLNQSTKSETATERLERITKQLENLPSVASKSTLQDLIDGKYKITLREYTNLNSYRNVMNSLYGNKSANSFTNTINKILGKDEDDDTLANAKTFVEKMKENGYSNSSAVKLYTALKSYSLISAIQNNSSNKNNSYVSAKV